MSPEPRHGWRLFTIWAVLSVAACLVIWFVWYPHMPPGRMSTSATHQQFDIAVLAVTAAPVIIGVLLYFGYAIVVWRARPGDESDGPAIYGNTKVQATWIIGTSVIDYQHPDDLALEQEAEKRLIAGERSVTLTAQDASTALDMPLVAAEELLQSLAKEQYERVAVDVDCQVAGTDQSAGA